MTLGFGAIGNSMHARRAIRGRSFSEVSMNPLSAAI
jgi:hypothetical protein